LAEFALKDQDNWNADTIKIALNTPKTQRVILKKPIPVLFFYTTAFLTTMTAWIFTQIFMVMTLYYWKLSVNRMICQISQYLSAAMPNRKR
jgi:hypothetical protein